MRATRLLCLKRVDNTRALRVPRLRSPLVIVVTFPEIKDTDLPLFSDSLLFVFSPFHHGTRVLPQQFCSGPHDGSGNVHDEHTIEAPTASDVGVWNFSIAFHQPPVKPSIQSGFDQTPMNKANLPPVGYGHRRIDKVFSLLVLEFNTYIYIYINITGRLTGR